MRGVIYSSLLDLIGSAGRLGSEVAVRLDMVQAAGLGHAFRRLRADAKIARLDQGGGDAAYRAIWRDAAEELGADIVELPGSFLEIRKGRQRTRVWNHWVMLDDAVTLRLAMDKSVVHRLLKTMGLRVPEHVEFTRDNPRRALDFLRTSNPCVVKPASSSGGSGVTGCIRRPSHFVRAKIRASRIDTRLLIERQVSGDFYRLLFLDGDLLDVVRRAPPHVTGDGHSTIERLISAENQRRIAASSGQLITLLKVDLDCIFTLEEANLRLKSVPLPGATVRIKSVISQNSVEENETVRGPISDQLVEEARVAARVAGLRLAGVDVITTDPTKSLEASSGVILEVNGTPGLHYHYQVADRANATRVAIPVLDKLLS
jgi:D-alanine-D-alanine ligase-like ATP-grasp enzyme